MFTNTVLENHAKARELEKSNPLLAKHYYFLAALEEIDYLDKIPTTEKQLRGIICINACKLLLKSESNRAREFIKKWKKLKVSKVTRTQLTLIEQEINERNI